MTATILVVDDDPAIVNMLKENFEADGYAVATGFDGQMALQLARQRKPNLIVMDVNMPMTNGLKALEFLRKSPETRAIPIIFLTGEASNVVFPTLSSQQRIAHLKKPIDLQDLNEMVRLFLQKYRTE